MCTALEGMYYQRHFQGNIDFNTVNIHLPRDGFPDTVPRVWSKNFPWPLKNLFFSSGNLLGPREMSRSLGNLLVVGDA